MSSYCTFRHLGNTLAIRSDTVKILPYIVSFPLVIYFMTTHSPLKKALREGKILVMCFRRNTKHIQISPPATPPRHNFVAVVGQAWGLVVTFFNWNGLGLQLRDHSMYWDLQLPFPMMLHWTLSPLLTQTADLRKRYVDPGSYSGLLHLININFLRNNSLLPILLLLCPVVPIWVLWCRSGCYMFSLDVELIWFDRGTMLLLPIFTYRQLAAVLVFMSCHLSSLLEQSQIFKLWTTHLLLKDAQMNARWLHLRLNAQLLLSLVSSLTSYPTFHIIANLCHRQLIVICPDLTST